MTGKAHNGKAPPWVFLIWFLILFYFAFKRRDTENIYACIKTVYKNKIVQSYIKTETVGYLQW